MTPQDTSKSTDLVTAGVGGEVIPADRYAISGNLQGVLDVVRQNVGASGLTVFDLERIKVPAGGITQWQVPTLDGGTDSVRNIEGVVVYWREPRAWWRLTLDESGGGSPPDCSANDGIVGIGDFGRGSAENPSGLCQNCPMSEWGSSAKSERGQACKQMRLLFLLQPDDLLPIALFLPPTSIKPAKQFFLRLASKGKAVDSVVTRLGLEEATNAGGIKYARATFQVAGVLDPAAHRMVQEYAASIKAHLDDVVLTEEDVADLSDDDAG